LAPYNPQDLPKLLFKRCADCQEIAIITKVPYIDEQLLMNIINLLAHCGMYTHKMEDWDRRADANKAWLHLRLFIQTAYQSCLQTGDTMAAQGGYTNRYGGLSAEDEVSDKDMAETIAGTMNLHMVSLYAQTTVSIEANAAKINALLQQLAANNNQLNLQQQTILQQMAMLSTNCPSTTMARTYVPPAPNIFSPPPLQGYRLQYQQLVQQSDQ
jgi:hypothetical protein